MPSVTKLIPLLQVAIGPVILISGVGLLLLTMTNRYGRVIDRARIIDSQLPGLSDQQRTRKSAQLSVLWSRACMVRLAKTLASLSALSASLLVVVLFLVAIFQTESAWLI
ncbi:MAG: DUF2721 domain-containing protein [Anaerolineales bacterium]|nr:DUF2721 domain-containing protein [Anaerolineales bacterium]